MDHTWDGDIALFLIAPDGTWLELSSANGLAGDNYKITEFRDDAPFNIISGSPPFNGQFQAEGTKCNACISLYQWSCSGTFNFWKYFLQV